MRENLRPLLIGLDFTRNGLPIAYRASLEPQIVTISLTTGVVSSFPYAYLLVRKLLTSVNSGSAGSVWFSPMAGVGVIVDESPDLCGQNYLRRLRLAAADPLFLRTVVEELRAAGLEQP